MKDFITAVQTSDIAFYGYDGVPLFEEKNAGSVNYFVKKKAAAHHKAYQSFRDIYEAKTTVTFLDHEAIRNALLGFPINAQYVAMRLRFSRDWVYGALGLLRRLLSGQVRILGVYKVRTTDTTSRWLMLRSNLPNITKNITLATPGSVDDVQKLIRFLNEKKVQYVILRNYEYLPKLHREHGDVDFLVADNDVEVVKEFLLQNPGKQNIGLHSVSIPKSKIDSVSYLPPKKAKEIISNAVSGRCESRIPNPVDAFLSYAYHCVYNKGIASGVPSRYKDLPVNKVLENNYIDHLQQLALAANIEDVELTMEGLDSYLHAVGWRPHMDTLTKLSDRNAWIKRHFFTQHIAKDEVVYVVLILRKSDMSEATRRTILEFISNYGFAVVFDKSLQGAKKALAEESLRGGVWVGRHESKPEQYLPSDFIVVTDLYSLHKNKQVFAYRVRLLKNQLRRTFGAENHGANFLHSTDNTEEAKEYIETVYPECLDDIVKAVLDVKKQQPRVRIPFSDWYELFKFGLKDKKAAVKKNIRVRVVNFVFNTSSS